MRTRALGKSGLHVPCICFGAYALGGGYWGAQDEGEAVRAVERALELGMNAFDTAPVYGFGRSEELLGRALRGRRAQALVLGKVGLRWDLADARGRRSKAMLGPDGQPREVACDSRPASVRAEVEASLRRLGCEQLDLVQVHARDPLTPIAETMGALEELRARGLVRAIGLSNYTPAETAEAERALAPSPLASLQLQYSLLARGIERELLPWARAHEVGLLAYAPLDQGLLSGKVGPERRFEAGTGRARRPSFAPQNRARVNAVLEGTVAPIARAHGASIAAVVLAWTVAQPGISAALVGARNPAQVEENARAGELELGPHELAAIERAFARLVLAPPPGAGWRAQLRYAAASLRARLTSPSRPTRSPSS